MIRPIIALPGLMALLLLALIWELSTPEDGAYNGGPTPSRPGTAARTSPEPPRARSDGSETAILADLAASIVARSLFSPTRRDDDQIAEKSPVGTTEGGLPRLSGVVVGPTGGRAIFAGADGKSRMAAEGDMVGAFKVRSIGPGVVTLSGSDGERVLRPAFITTARQNTAAPAVDGGPPTHREPGR